MDISALLFIGLCLVLIAATVLALLRIGFARLDSSIGILGDGLPKGQLAPRWDLPDLQGVVRSTPSSDGRWQFLVFAGSPLANAPLLVDGMDALNSEADLQVMLVSHESAEVSAGMVRALGLRIPVVPAPRSLLDRYRIRVMPFGALVDPGGSIQWMGLINTDVQMSHTWQVTREVDRRFENAGEVR